MKTPHRNTPGIKSRIVIIDSLQLDNEIAKTMLKPRQQTVQLQVMILSVVSSVIEDENE